MYIDVRLHKKVYEKGGAAESQGKGIERGGGVQAGCQEEARPGKRRREQHW